jgi:putative membrane protein
MMWGYYNNPLGWGFGGLIMILFWILVIWLIFSLFRGCRGRSHWTEEKDRPLEILRERYAKGEIDKEEYEIKKKT